MASLWFVVPVHGRLPLAAICLRQLRRTCDALTDNGIDATAVVVSDDDTLTDLRERLDGTLGFHAVARDNRFLSRRFNDGIQLACDPKWNAHPADYVVPCGSDDWIDYRILLDLPRHHTVLGFQHIAFVREDGREMTSRFLGYPGGCGIRVYPRQLMAECGYRPAAEDLARGCDTSILHNVQTAVPFGIDHRVTDPRQIVDWKTRGANLNPYESLSRHHLSGASDPFVALADIFPAESLAEMAAHYGRPASVSAEGGAGRDPAPRVPQPVVTNHGGSERVTA